MTVPTARAQAQKCWLRISTPLPKAMPPTRIGRLFTTLDTALHRRATTRGCAYSGRHHEATIHSHRSRFISLRQRTKRLQGLQGAPVIATSFTAWPHV